MLKRNAVIEYAKSFVYRLVSKGIVINNAYLFGSYAKNKATSDSDIDVLLVSDSFSGVGFIDYEMFLDELIEFDNLHVKTYQTSTFKENDPFINEIKNTGIELRI